MPLTEFQFGSEAIDYIRSRLSIGKTLSKLAQSLPWDEGVVKAYLPSELGIERAQSTIEHGCPEIDKSARESRELVEKFIFSYLTSPGRPYAVFEHVLASSSDPWISESQDRLFTFKDDVYLFLPNCGASLDTVRRVLSGEFVRGILTSLKDIPDLANRQSVGLDVLQMLVKRVEHLIIGAYDETTYLIWSKRDQS
jgi:hypothetical protein